MERIAEELNDLNNKGNYRKIPNITTKEGCKVIIDGKEYLNFASNDYLNIATNLELKEEFISKNNSSLSSASARLLTGTSEEFNELEITLSLLFNKEKALIFNTGYQCNLGVISALISKGDVVFSDKLNHASIIDGMKLSDGDFYRFRHLDYDNLEKLLQTKRTAYNRALIISESIFSMDGDRANIKKLIELKNKYNCLLMIDEAHAFGAIGNDLTGLCNSYKVDIITATFGKAIGSFGAFCVANEDIINYLINKARSFIFSTSIPPINIAWTNWLLNDKKDYLLKQKFKLNNNIQKAKSILDKYGVNTPCNTHIIPIMIGDNNTTLNLTEKLKSLGYYIPAIRPPTVAPNTSRLRISLTAETNINDFEEIIKLIQTTLI